MSATSENSYSPAEFAAAERISRAQLYILWQQGRGPRYYNAGAGDKNERRRITHQARLDWQAEREAESAAKGGA